MTDKCAGARTIAEVKVEHLERADGKPDRKVIIVRDCSHPYYWGAPITAPVPVVGSPAWHCPEGLTSHLHAEPFTPEGPTLFKDDEPKKRRTRYRAA